MFNCTIFGTRLAKLRRETGMTATALGHMLGVSSTQIGDMEKGKTATSMARLYMLCEIFHVSSDYLLGLKDEEN